MSVTTSAQSGSSVTASVHERAAGLPDASIIQRSLQSPGAFAALFDRHADDIYRYAARRLGPEMGEELMAETFAVAFQRRDRYDLARGDARPWLYGIVTNLVARHRRLEARRWRALARAPRPAPVEAATDEIAARLDARSRQPELAAALAGLSERHRDVVLLMAWAELDYAEAAEALGVPIGTVRSRLHRARAALRTTLDPATAGTEDLTDG
jgi:RNA polymerase sigma factor (sigma-70 family)